MVLLYFAHHQKKAFLMAHNTKLKKKRKVLTFEHSSTVGRSRRIKYAIKCSSGCAFIKKERRSCTNLRSTRILEKWTCVGKEDFQSYLVFRQNLAHTHTYIHTRTQMMVISCHPVTNDTQSPSAWNQITWLPWIQHSCALGSVPSNLLIKQKKLPLVIWWKIQPLRLILVVPLQLR